MDGLVQILWLINALGEVKGRKKLQKLVYILQWCGHDFPQHFGYLHYGPYSSQLAAEVDSLGSGKLVKEEGSGVEYEPYVYKPTPAAQQLLRELEMRQAPWGSLALELNAKDANFLEAMSTILYLRANGFEGTSLRERFVSLKPSLKGSFDQAEREAAQLPANRSLL